MTDNGSEIVIVGAGEMGEIAYEYFSHDSPYTVVAFAVEERWRKRDELLGLPVVPFEDLEAHFDPVRHKAFVALSGRELNRPRTRVFRETKAKGFVCVSYVSSHAFVWHNVEIGENCFIFENNVVQHNVVIGDNVILWSGNHVGHGTRIGANCFVSSHVVI